MEHQSILKIIRDKRDGKELSSDEIEDFIAALGTPDLSEAQIGAFLMAVYLNGLTTTETQNLTKFMALSGVCFKWPEEWKGSIVDKHATGGVGDKTSLVLAPALAACGLRIPMISGRSLGHTGGTLDKLESIPGFNIHLDASEIKASLETSGCCIASQTDDIVPADKVLYRLRDATATVENNGLIVASIVSKKAAEGLDALVLDVKFGSGTLIKDLEAAKFLAKAMVDAGQIFDMKVSTVLSRMDAPLGFAVGNALEVAEAVETLQNKGPDDLLELVAALGGKLLKSTGRAKTVKEGKTKIRDVIQQGDALRRFSAMLISQGCEPAVAQELCHGNIWKILQKAPKTSAVQAESSGFLESLDAFTVGSVSHGLGSMGDLCTKHSSGIVLKKKPGDAVVTGDVILQVHHDDGDISAFLDKLKIAVKINLQKPKVLPLIHKM